MEIAHFRKLLLDKQKELQTEAAELHQDALTSTTDDVGDFVDVATSEEGTSESLEEETRVSETLILVEDALRRMESGTYGKCLTCGHPIEQARLEAVPWAQYCVEDQEKMDRAAHVPQGGSTL